MTTPRSRLGRVSIWLGRLAVLAALVGPTIAHFELVAPLIGFIVFGAGVLLAVLSLLIRVVAVALRPARPPPHSGRGGLAAPALLLLLVLPPRGRPAPPPAKHNHTHTPGPPP